MSIPTLRRMRKYPAVVLAVMMSISLSGILPSAAVDETLHVPGYANDNALGLTGFDHVSINVEDFDQIIAWYRDILGLQVEVSWTVGALNGKQLAYLTLNGRRVVEIVAADANGTGLKPPTTFGQHFGRTGYGHLCFATDSVDKTMATLEARGVPVFVKAETYSLDGTVFRRRVAFIQDPEGNVIEFGEPLARMD